MKVFNILFQMIAGCSMLSLAVLIPTMVLYTIFFLPFDVLNGDAVAVATYIKMLAVTVGLLVVLGCCFVAHIKFECDS